MKSKALALDLGEFVVLQEETIRPMQEPLVAYVIDELCAGCGFCLAACPYEARELNALTNVAEVNPALCQGCGACVVACPNKASKLRNTTPEQVLTMVDAML